VYLARIASVFVSGAIALTASTAGAAAPAPAPPRVTDPDAKAADEPKFAFEVAPAFVLPVGNLADAASVGFGALAGMRRPIVAHLDVTARAGFVYHLSKDGGGGGSVGLSEVPILGGVRYTFVPVDDGGLYGAAELGLSLIFARTSIPANALVPGQSASQSDTKASTAHDDRDGDRQLHVRGALTGRSGSCYQSSP
jgi:hypothetical protein